ncbi:rod shape-determining protein MreD [Listeria sp. PSOL-1]|uniref:rod shape-determining protein MreD n=1 Tax=Listeria sp. PSOL-1 TaxID=1844999 RepID=UPI0013D87C4E|nr:rod shape-determining protein MreD [Listeria sp. PSOL-1]
MDVKKNIWLPVIMIGTFILEGIIGLFFAKPLFGETRQFIPHFLLVLLILLTVFYRRNHALLYAFILGIVFDIYYTSIMGIYFAIFPLIVYLTDKFMKVLHDNIILVGLVTLFNIILTESLVYLFYTLIGATTMSISTFVDTRLVTTLLLNLAFFLLVFFPFQFFIDKLKKSEKI